MKVIIAGSRDLSIPSSEINRILGIAGFRPDVIVSGGARGIDRCGESYAEDNQIPIKRFLADWDKHGKAAGPIRNAEMAEYADALVAFPGIGKGTWGMIKLMIDNGKPLVVYDLSKNRFLETWEIGM